MEINEDVFITLNDVPIVETLDAKTGAIPSLNAIAQISLGAPGLPSKRLLTCEKNVRGFNLKNNNNKVRIAYVDAFGTPISPDLGFRASIDVLSLYK